MGHDPETKMRGHNVLGPLGVVLAVLVIASQVLVVYNYRNKLASRNIQEGPGCRRQPKAAEGSRPEARYI